MIAALSQVHHDIDERGLIAISFCVQCFIVLGQDVLVKLSITCHAMYQYYLVKCITPMRIFTATTTDESCSCPHYRGYIANSIHIPAVLPWLLSPFPWEYCHYCPHHRGNYRSYHGITAVPISMSLFSRVGMLIECSTRQAQVNQ